MPNIKVPFFRPLIGPQEVDEVLSTLLSGRLSTGPKVKLFEERFAAAIGASHAVAVNSCTAALHLSVGAMGLEQGQAVLIPTMAFPSTAEVVRHHGAIPILVDCDPFTTNMDLDDAARKMNSHTVGILPVYVGGLMMDVDALSGFARRNGLWLIEDAAHAFPSAWRRDSDQQWQRCGQATAAVTCFSFSSSQTITTGEGGMAVTDNVLLARRLRMMSLHGLSHNPSNEDSNDWDYQIVMPGYKYNLTDIAASIGLHQLARAEEMRQEREAVAMKYLSELSEVAEIELPPVDANRIHSWQLFPIKLRLDRLSISRDSFMKKLKRSGVDCSVHWRPLHLHPYYREKFGWQPQDFPVATSLWKRLISLPMFPGMRAFEVKHVIDIVKNTCASVACRKPVARAEMTVNESALASYVR